MKVAAVIKKIKTHFKKQGIDIEVTNDSGRWSFEYNGYVGSFLANGRSTAIAAAFVLTTTELLPDGKFK